MPALTPQFLIDFETRMQSKVENEYARLSQNLFWSRIMRTMQSESAKEIVAWLLSTAKIEDQGKGGNVAFEDLVSTYTSFVSRDAGAGLKLRRQQLEDLDGNGMNLAAKWSGDIGAYMAYWPQKQLINLIKNGHLSTSLGYDAVSFFNAAHPVNPFNTGYGTYANLFTGAASGQQAGACPIDDSVSVDVALTNLSKVFAAIRSIKMPNGEDPRFLKPEILMGGPRLQNRIVQLTNAKFLAQAAASGGGSGDVEAVVQAMGFVKPIIADELAGFESDTTYFVGCREVTSTELGAFVYVDREPFHITYYTGEGGGATGVDAVLARSRELEWQCHGRNVAGYGHPYAFFKCKAV